MGLFENLFGGKEKRMAAEKERMVTQKERMVTQMAAKIERMAAINDYESIVSVILTDPNSNVVYKASEALRRMALHLGTTWENLFTLGINIASKIIANPPLDYDRAKYAYVVYDQMFTKAPYDSEFKNRPILVELLEGVQQTLLKLYLDGGDYFHNILSDNALKSGSNRLHPLYLQKLYAQLIQEGKQRSKKDDYYWENNPQTLSLIPKELYEK